MDDNSNNQKPDSEELKALRIEKAIEKSKAIKEANKFNKEGSKWSLIQEVMQEIVATHTIENPDKRPSIQILADQLKSEISKRYAENKEMRDTLLSAIPSNVSIQNSWFKKDGWEEAVWSKVRVAGLFSKERRARMINSLFERGMSKSDNAAKIWLTLSGDYSEKSQETEKNKTMEVYREINELLHKKNNS